MFLFGLEGSGFIISLALTLLVSGAVMFYCLRRFKVIENTIIEQSRVIQSFIMKQQQETGLASPIALHSAQLQQEKLNEIQENSHNEVIEVSDESDDEYENDDDEQSENDSDNDSASSNDDKLELINDKNDITLNISSIENINEFKVENLNDKLELESVKVIALEEPSQSLKQAVVEELLTDNKIKIDDNNLTPIIPTDNINNEKPDYKSMKVNELRKLVSTQNLTDESTVKNLGKKELIELLQK
tara:strand:- start:592 stop:1326 length:735 start_codon:yes stop_codon:yes gene_type:complete